MNRRRWVGLSFAAVVALVGMNAMAAGEPHLSYVPGDSFNGGSHYAIEVPAGAAHVSSGRPKDVIVALTTMDGRRIRVPASLQSENGSYGNRRTTRLKIFVPRSEMGNVSPENVYDGINSEPLRQGQSLSSVRARRPAGSIALSTTGAGHPPIVQIPLGDGVEFHGAGASRRFIAPVVAGVPRVRPPPTSRTDHLAQRPVSPHASPSGGIAHVDPAGRSLLSSPSPVAEVGTGRVKPAISAKFRAVRERIANAFSRRPAARPANEPPVGALYLATGGTRAVVRPKAEVLPRSLQRH